MYNRSIDLQFAVWTTTCLIAVACVKRDSEVRYPLPAVAQIPYVYAVDTISGYPHHPIYGHAVRSVVRNSGDTVKTGRSNRIKGKTLPPEAFSIVTTPSAHPVFTQDFPTSKLLQKKREIHIADTEKNGSRTQYRVIESDTLRSHQNRLSVTGNRVPYRTGFLVKAQNPQRRYDAISNIQYLGKEEGLYNENVTSLYQDDQGYLWICLHLGGLMRYDGSFFEHHSTFSGLPNNQVMDIIRDRSGGYWICTSGGLTYFDGKSYVNYLIDNRLVVGNWYNCIEEDTDGNLWLGTEGNGLIRLSQSTDKSRSTVTIFGHQDSLQSLFIRSIFEDRLGNLWIGTRDQGIYRMSRQDTHLTDKFTAFSREVNLPGNAIHEIIEDRHGNLWFATDQGVCRLKFRNPEQEAVFTVFRLADGSAEPVVNTVCEDAQGNIWIGTDGLGAFQLLLGQAEGDDGIHYAHFTTHDGLTKNKVSAIIEDESGNVWIGTDGGGLCVLRARRFTHYSAAEGFTDVAVNAIFRDENSRLWFATDGDGIIVNRNEISIAPQWARYSMTTGLPENTITAVVQDGQGDMWFGTMHSGLVHFNERMFTVFTLRDAPGYNQITTLAKDGLGNIWAGTWGGGMIHVNVDCSLEIRKPCFAVYSDLEGVLSNYVTTILNTSNDHLWIGYFGGLSHFVPGREHDTEGSITHYTEANGLPFRNILSLLEDRSGNLWLGSGAGLVQWPVKGGIPTDSFILYDFWKNSIVNNVRSVLEDQAGNIWTSTHAGLRVTTPSHDRRAEYKDIRLFRPDGVKAMEFISNSACMDHRNLAWWGGRIGGVEVIDLNEFVSPVPTTTPLIHRITINELQLHFLNLADSLRSDMRFDSVASFASIPNRLTLTSKFNHLTFYFSSQELSTPHKLNYTFKLEGLEDEWSQITTRNQAEYRGLRPGRYLFKVRAAGEMQQWSAAAEFPIHVLPPWWFSWWAVTIYAIAGAGAILALYRFQLRRRLEIAEKTRLMELDTLKNKLYTNITHEFRTPLTLIHGHVANAMNTQTPLEQKDLRSIYAQSERLQKLIGQMLDLQKVEAGKLRPDFQFGDVVAVVRALHSLFQSAAEAKSIAFAFEADPSEVLMDYDEEKLTQIITNLLSNALKHTPDNGRISTLITQKANALQIEIRDNGTGISADEIPHIFEQYYQSKRAAAGGTGIGLALTKNLVELLGGTISVSSEEHSGSSFMIVLPIHRYGQKTTVSRISSVPPLHASAIVEAAFPEPAQDHSGKPIVLIVEDHPEVRQFVVSCLKHYHTVAAANGHEGLSVAREIVPDLVVSDVMMPDLDGFELCAHLKRDIQTSHIPVILLTGRGDQAALLHGLEHGADAYIVKPFDPLELQVRVRKLLELRETLSQHYRRFAGNSPPSPVEQSSPYEHAFLQKVRAFVEEHMNDAQFNMQMLCQHVAMSHPQLHRKITALTGESTGRFVRSVRLTKAIELLRTTDDTIAQIAYETGFSDPGYFSKVFSKELGENPTEYRARLSS